MPAAPVLRAALASLSFLNDVKDRVGIDNREAEGTNKTNPVGSKPCNFLQRAQLQMQRHLGHLKIDEVQGK